MCNDRRHFLKTGLGSLAAASVFPTSHVFALGGARRSPLNPVRMGQRVVVINVEGGWDSLNVIVPHTLNTYYQRRPTLAQPAPNPQDPLASLPLETDVGMHYLMPEMQAIYQAGEMAIVQKTGYPNPNGSHFTSRDIMSRGIRDATHPDQRGWLGRLGDLYFTSGIEIMGLGVGNRFDFVANTLRPVVASDLDELSIAIDSDHPLDSELRNAKAREVLTLATGQTGDLAAITNSARSSFQVAEDVEATLANYPGNTTYPSTTIARRLRDVARLMSGNLGTQVYYVATGGFDTHSNQVASMNARLPQISQAVGSFRSDLQSMSLWNDTTVVLISEFGRRNFENGGAGTDHGHGVHFMVLGGSVNGGLKGNLVTETDMTTNFLAGEIDFRQIYSEILNSRLGVDPTPVFPGYTPPAGNLGLFI